MSTNTKSDTSVNVINVITDAQEEELLSYMRSLHGKTLTILQSVGVKPTFNDNFAKCGAEDFKNLHQATRTLLTAKGRDRKEKRVAGIRTKIQGVVDTHMSQARAAKAAMEAMPEDVRKYLPAFSNVVKVPLSDIRACFPQGASDTEVFADLEYLGYKVTDMTTNGKVIVPFTTEAPKVDESAPKSEKTAKAA